MKTFVTLTILVMTVAACASQDGMAEKTQVADMTNVLAARGALLGSQPSARALAVARKKHGTKTVINLRMPEEYKYFLEEQATRDLGMKYVSIPFRMAPSLTDDVFADIRGTLNDRNNWPVMLHCASGNRVGAVWYAWLVLDQGVSEEEAMAEAKAVGLRKEGHIARTQAYVREMQAK